MPRMFQTVIQERYKNATNREVVNDLVQNTIEVFQRLGVELQFDDPVMSKKSEYITLDDYQKSALLTANKNREFGDQLMNTVLGLGGEAGEVIDVLSQISAAIAIKSGKVLDDVKKYSFHNWSEMYQAEEGAFEILREKLGKELGDLLWYIAVLADSMDYKLGEIAKINRQKLIERHGSSEPTPVLEVGYQSGGDYTPILKAFEGTSPKTPLHMRNDFQNSPFK